MRPQTIQIYLPFGDPQGIRVAEITTRTVQIFDIPRAEIGRFFEMPESDQVALYFLFGDEDETSRTKCYIGQTGASRDRFKEHLKKKEFWSRAVVVVSRTNTKTDTHARYLEWKSIKEGHAAGRYALENGNAGSRPHTPAPLEAECEEIFDTTSVLLSTLGFPVFKKLASTDDEPSNIKVFCKGRGAQAEGFYSNDGLTVKAGSRCAVEPTNRATPDAIKLKRERYLEDGTLKLEGDVPVFTRDTLFKTPSGAADVVMYRVSNGWTEWKVASGETLNDATGRVIGKE